MTQTSYAEMSKAMTEHLAQGLAEALDKTMWNVMTDTVDPALRKRQAEIQEKLSLKGMSLPSDAERDNLIAQCAIIGHRWTIRFRRRTIDYIPDPTHCEFCGVIKS